jgi:phosphoglycolate phosphatase
MRAAAVAAPGAALAAAAVVEREPTITGKPSPFLLSDIIARHNCVPQKMIMVGDRLDTDILWGRNTGMATLLVMTGGDCVCVTVWWP